MVTQSIPAAAAKKTVSPRHALLEKLIGVVTAHVNEQLLPMSARLAAAMLDTTDMAGEPREVHLRFKAGNLLKINGYAFLPLAAARLERAVRLEIAHLAAPKAAVRTPAQAMSLVPYEEMDSQVAFSTLSRPFEVRHGDQLATLNVRLAFLLERDILRTSQNPFRPDVFLTALQQAWQEFDPDTESHKLLAPLLRPEIVFDMGPMLEALNLMLMKEGVLPGSVDSYRNRKTDSHDATPKAGRALNQAVLAQQLRQFFSADEGGAAEADPYDLTLPQLDPGWQREAVSQRYAEPRNERVHRLAQIGAKQPLLSYLARLQKQAAPAGAASVAQLPGIKERAPRGSLTRADENTIDLLSAIFEAIFQDQNISQEIRDLIRFLQIPVLKAALVDKDFFFQEAHPARRLIDLLSHTGGEQRRGPEDPLFKAMQASVDRVGRDVEQEMSVFAEAVTELEASIRAEEQAASTAIAEPIALALRQEKMVHATRSAKNAVALRLGSGEVLAVVETFLENKWVSVLTIAYSVEDEKPGAVDNATRTMDDLIWSVKPKLSAQERKQFIGKLPALLSALNKWLDIVKWQDADRLQFFAELAECHASIVRAPLELSPERQLEIAVEVAQQAAQRRLERQSRAVPEPEALADDAVVTVDTLQRGIWMAFAQDDGSSRKVKLAWISPLRTLFIFSTGTRQEAFSMSGEALAQQVRDEKVQIIRTDGMVGRALSQALEQVAVNDASMSPRVSA